MSEQRRLALTEGTGLAALTALVPPPEHPTLGEHSWEWLFVRLGTRLPADFVALMDTYGSGTRLYRDKRDTWPDHYPLPVWPETGGILPFAWTIDADWLAWLTIGDPDDWPVIHLSRHFSGHRSVMTCAVTDLLLDWARGGPLFDLEWEDDEDSLEDSFFEPL